MLRNTAASAVLVLLIAACGAPAQRDGEPDDNGFALAPQDAFWANLQGLCEAAYPGVMLQVPEGDTQVDPDADLIVHFWQCGDEELRFPFHVNENRSRTWFFIRHADAIEIRHDHRHEDGTEEANTWYGASTLDEGTASRQEFVTERNGVRVGWRVEIHPSDRYVYGTIRDGEWRHRAEFDLTREVEPPPLPWGHEVRPEGRR